MQPIKKTIETYASKWVFTFTEYLSSQVSRFVTLTLTWPWPDLTWPDLTLTWPDPDRLHRCVIREQYLCQWLTSSTPLLYISKYKFSFSFIVWCYFFFTLLSYTSTPASSFRFVDRPWSVSRICASGLLLRHLYYIYLNTNLVSRLLCSLCYHTSTPVSSFRFVDLDPWAEFVLVAYFFDISITYI